ncbi:PilZ domain-containing protein [Pseudobacteriovorax antillogorgiicola]|uniref:PilZ domain-containing protein n=1 Tax=Pseudobacteriovorax antillogorgiicola TaxID=1513793 RepID=A0A1Y6CQ57_9BACT|nr:PilZ domain-containing protein [Pseudobacteriovorax antillogorgiicola]TCS42210.1 PilZ domain-containing protein [Pseudobacteriovorax antillogorgiicola]SMF82825.1 PilZ domain-containing protein [Pseudobacteriovorax antillogorgiicola]
MTKCSRYNDRIEFDKTISVIIKNTRLRFSCYWLKLKDLSENGVGLIYNGKGILPLKIGDFIDITLDVHCRQFQRPIHLVAEIIHQTSSKDPDDETEVIFIGAKITNVDERHQVQWKEDLATILKVSK